MAEATVALSFRVAERTRADVVALAETEGCTLRALLERMVQYYRLREKGDNQAVAE